MSDDQTNHFTEHRRLLMALTELNSDHLRAEQRLAGAEIALEAALNHEVVVHEPAAFLKIAVLRDSFDKGGQWLRTIESERRQLEHALQVLNQRPEPLLAVDSPMPVFRDNHE